MQVFVRDTYSIVAQQRSKFSPSYHLIFCLGVGWDRCAAWFGRIWQSGQVEAVGMELNGGDRRTYMVATLNVVR